MRVAYIFPLRLFCKVLGDEGYRSVECLLFPLQFLSTLKLNSQLLSIPPLESNPGPIPLRHVLSTQDKTFTNGYYILYLHLYCL